MILIKCNPDRTALKISVVWILVQSQESETMLTTKGKNGMKKMMWCIPKKYYTDTSKSEMVPPAITWMNLKVGVPDKSEK